MDEVRCYADEDAVDWALRSGRITAKSAPLWRRRLLEDRSKVRASNGQPVKTECEHWLELLEPLTPVASSRAALSEPTGRGQYDDLFPALTTSEQERRWAEQDAADDQREAEQDAADDQREAQREAERNQAAASLALSEDEYKSIFGH